jgi:tetratricopeptide (TPR) repeat protein
VGRHFLFRNDYPSALEILEAWGEANYGPADLHELRRQLMPILYLNLGRPDDAVPLLRANVASFAAGYEANSADHVAQATQLASITSAPEDLARAEAVLARAMEDRHGPGIQMYFANQLSIMRRLQGDLDGALEALREVKAVIDSNRLMDISGKDTGLLNLAEFEFYHGGDVEAAEGLAQRVLQELAPARGESRESGRALLLLGMIRLRQGREAQALDLLEQAVASISRFSGERSLVSVYALAGLLEAQAASGQSEAAAESAARLQAAIPEQDPRRLARTRAECAQALARQQQRSEPIQGGAVDQALMERLEDLARTEPIIGDCRQRLEALMM